MSTFRRPFTLSVLSVSLGLFIGPTSFSAVPEILSLPQDAVVPHAIYGKYSVDAIATALVQRLHRLVDGRTDGAPFFDFMGKTKITIAFDSKNLNSIMTGCFKNQHQTGTSRGMLAQATRASVEDHLLKLRLEDSYQSSPASIPNQIRPKYSYLSFQDFKAGMDSNTYLDRYGNTVALIKDEVKERSTFTPDDSLVVDDGTEGNTVRTFFLLEKPPLGNEERYWEVQIWGTLCSQHVEAWLVNCPTSGTKKLQTPASAIAELKATGIPVHQCEKNEFGFWKKGDELK